MDGESVGVGGSKQDMLRFLSALDRWKTQFSSHGPTKREALNRQGSSLGNLLDYSPWASPDLAKKPAEPNNPQKTGKPLKLQTGIPGLEITIENPYRGIWGSAGEIYQICDEGILYPGLPKPLLETAMARQRVNNVEDLQFFPVLESITAHMRGVVGVFPYIGLYDDQRQWADGIGSPALQTPSVATPDGGIRIPWYHRIHFKRDSQETSNKDSVSPMRAVTHGFGDHIAIVPYGSHKELFNGTVSVELPKNYSPKSMGH
ncbi:hypothetical protein HYU14_00065 [Candidatus Woesearchaeota archaeon]|nr:hypothetical protein [Candidatus Woesearchaeota archaeon]